MRITLCVTNSLEQDHRVHKVASSLMGMGHSVRVVGCLKPGWREIRREYGVERLPLWFCKSVLFYVEIMVRMFVRLMKDDGDVYWANDADTLLACWAAARIRGKRFVADLHELFPEVPEVVDRKFVKWVWTKVEDLCVPRVDAGMTVCESIADYYYERYGVRLEVVRNIPRYAAYEGRGERGRFAQIPDGKRIVLYQGAVNVGRGVEWVMEAMPMVKDAVFVVAGKGDLYEELKERAEREYAGKVVFLGQMAHEELRPLTVMADVGVCLLEAKGLSYYYALPNRVFDLISAHVPILATDFPEIRRVVERYGSGRLTKEKEPERIAEILNEMLDEERDDGRFERAARELCWEEEEKVLRRVVERAMGKANVKE